MEDGDLSRVGAYRRQDVSRTLWPWLKSRGYATDDDDDDPVLEEWLASRLGKRAAFLRAGLRLKRRCGPGASPAALPCTLRSMQFSPRRKSRTWEARTAESPLVDAAPARGRV
jgi:hypothetical protein